MNKLNELFNEFQEHLLEDKRPSIYFNDKLSSGIFYEIYPFTLLGDLIKTEQEPKHHPEGSVWRHTMMVVDECAERRESSKEPAVFMWAAILHDIGKAPTTKVRNGRITSYDHDKVGERLSRDFLTKLTDDTDFINKVAKLVRWHMQSLFVVQDMPYADITSMLNEVSLEEIALFSLCDRLGRGGLTDEKARQIEKNIELFVRKCSIYTIKL